MRYGGIPARFKKLGLGEHDKNIDGHIRNLLK